MLGCESVVWDMTYQRSRYSSHAADTKNVPFKFTQCLSKSLHLARLTFLMLSQGARHFLKTYNISCGTFSVALFRTRVHALHSLSAQGITGGSEVPAYDKCYILATDIYVIVFRAICIGIYYAVLIATPKPLGY